MSSVARQVALTLLLIESLILQRLADGHPVFETNPLTGEKGEFVDRNGHVLLTRTVRALSTGYARKTKRVAQNDCWTLGTTPRIVHSNCGTRARLVPPQTIRRMGWMRPDAAGRLGTGDADGSGRVRLLVAAAPAPASLVPAAAADVDIESAARALAVDGFCVLRGASAPLVPPELCSVCASAIDRRLKRLLTQVARQDFGMEEVWKYEEICHRHERSWRYDMSIDNQSLSEASVDSHGVADAASWAALYDAADRWARPVIDAAVRLLSESANRKGGAHRCMAGCVVAAPGALDQPFHSDGDEQLYNCFVPLVPVTSHNGPTQFVPGSHVADASGVGADERRRLTAPEVALGELIIFDYRVEHRGTSNCTGAARPVAYAVYAPEGVEHDFFNFPVGVSLLAGQAAEPADGFYAGGR